MMGFKEEEKIEKGFGQQLRKHLNVIGAITHTRIVIVQRWMLAGLLRVELVPLGLRWLN